MFKSHAVFTLFFFVVVAGVGLTSRIQLAWATVPETITIQGTLEAPGGGPLTGTYACSVRIWDASVGGSLLANSMGLIALSDAGRFSLELSLGDVFVPPAQAWYDLGVDTDNNGIEEAEFFPHRVRFHSVPFARVAANAELLGGLPASAFAQSGSAAQAWELGGNATSPGHFLGTTNDQPLELRVNNQRGWILIPNVTSPNLVGGHESNTIGASVEGGTIAGGGTSAAPNEVSGNYGTIGGGKDNKAQGQASTVSGGQGNEALGSIATVGGGDTNVATNDADTVSGGQGNVASGGGATIGGGAGNQASGLFATVGGGGLSNLGDPLSGNRVTQSYGTVSGGGNNHADGDYSSVSGGVLNTSSGDYSAIGGGSQNVADEEFASIAGGSANISSGGASAVGGGAGNQALGDWSTVAGGNTNSASGAYSSIGGGHTNEVQGIYGAIFGGWDNTITYGSGYSFIGAGRYNETSGEYATVGGGFSNSAGADYATIAGGGRSSPGNPSTGNRVTGNYGTVGGGGNNQAGDNSGSMSSTPYAAVGGGYSNEATGGYATVAGGQKNEATGINSTVSGGQFNEATLTSSTVGGGFLNKAYGNYATVPGGYVNNATGNYSFAAGMMAKADGEGSFVWGDSNLYALHAWNRNEFVCRATGGFWFITAIDATGYPTEGMQLPAGTSGWVPIGSTLPPKSTLEDPNAIEALREENDELRRRIDALESRLAKVEIGLAPAGREE